MTQKHTPGRWQLGTVPSSASDGSPVRRIENTDKGQSMQTLCDVYGLTQEEADANAARIVACVNACEGINPEAVPDTVKALEAVIHAAFEPTWAQLVADALAKAKAA